MFDWWHFINVNYAYKSKLKKIWTFSQIGYTDVSAGASLDIMIIGACTTMVEF